jgi:hypothetical protein
MDSAVAVSAVLIFLILQYPDDGNIGATNVALWWGNAVYTNTADYNAVPVRPLTSRNVNPLLRYRVSDAHAAP